MTQTVVGIFEDARAAQNAFDRLTSDGFSPSQIDMTSQTDIGDNGITPKEDRDRSDDDFGDRVSRFFKNLFTDEEDAERYSTVGRSGTVISVYADAEKAERAADILDEAGAIDVDERFKTSERSSTAGMHNEQSDEKGSQEAYLDRDRTNSPRSIPVIEEELQVGKREVETGGMRIRSRIIERPVEENLRLRQEHVTLERNPLNRPATESDLDTFREGEIEVRERAEIPVVNKEARVVEEINVRKDVEEREEVVRDTVRKTDVEIDQLEGNKDTVGNKSRSKRKM